MRRHAHAFLYLAALLAAYTALGNEGPGKRDAKRSLHEQIQIKTQEIRDAKKELRDCIAHAVDASAREECNRSASVATKALTEQRRILVQKLGNTRNPESGAEQSSDPI